MALTLTPGAKLVAATHNSGKARELAALLEGRFDVVTAAELGLREPDETESTFVGNALLKARHAADAAGLIALADDSGLSVAALDGAPGIYSARWAGPGRDFGLAMAKVEERLNETGTEDSAAWFTCALAVAWPDGPAVVVEGRVDGRLSFPPSGNKGFGYDPIFIPDGGSMTFGELEPFEKDAISHRARAFEKLKAALFLNPLLAVYVHWPYCARICPYCDFNVVRDRGRHEEQAALAAAIVRDLEAQAELTGPRDLVSIFFGGGTPSLMEPEWAGRIVETAKRLWPASELVEITLEANPTDAEAGRFLAFAGAGVQRLSLGVQSFDDDALRFLGRNHGAAEARRAVETARQIFPRLSLDLIYARPGQTTGAWAAELAEAISLGAEHLSPYQLTIETGTAFARMAARGRLTPPSADTGADLYEVTQAVLGDAGFDAYEVSNHARSLAARSRHNLAYWRGEDYIGVGPGAHGRLTLGGVRVATTAPSAIGSYLAQVSNEGVGFDAREALSPREAAQERLLMGLRVDEGLAFIELAALSLTAADPRVADLIEAGLLVPDIQRLRVTRSGRAVLDRLTRDLAG